jgi:hypothetical protein
MIRVIQYHLGLSNVFILARDQFNDHGAPGSREGSARQCFLTIERYKNYYLLILKGNEKSDSR